MHVHVDIERKDVLIIGWPAAGKTYLSKLLARDNPNHKLFHTDDYIKHGYKEALYVLMADIATTKKPTIVEGVQGYRLLRKGIELDSYYPEIVIELEISRELMYATYKNERADKDPTALKGFINAHEKILRDYRAMLSIVSKAKRPEWHKIKNNY